MLSLYLKLTIFSALCSAFWNIINDCDETFNYLEPLGFLFSTGNSTGFQTWEYSPKFGLRSYFYLWLIGWPVYILTYFMSPGWLQFLSLRLFLALVSAVSSALLASSSSSYLFPCNDLRRLTFGVIFCLIHCFAPGSFISASSSVPSALSASMTSLMLSAWLSGRFFYSVGTVALSAIILWPFSACLGAPLAFFLIASGMTMNFVRYSLFWGFVFSVPLVLVDSLYYGRLMFPTWNIIAYNVFSSLKGRSLSQLYGTDSVTYYVMNYFLNYNIGIIFVSIFIFPVLIYLVLMIRSDTSAEFRRRTLKLLWVTFTPLFVWNLVLFIQSHKEERFLFPCFPCLELLITALCVLFLNHKDIGAIDRSYHVVSVAAFLLLFVSLSLSRILALTGGYSSPMFLVQHLPTSDVPKNLCIGRDWHYFPSHFLLPRSSHGWRVHFLRSNFSGQLPGKFVEGVGILNSTRFPDGHFNDMNLPEEGTFFSLDKCDYILDRLSKPGENETQYSDDTMTWRVLLTRPILERILPSSNSSGSFLQKAFAKFQRAFFVPYLFRSNNVWKEMHILERIKPA